MYESRQWQRRSLLAASFVAIALGALLAMGSHLPKQSPGLVLEERINPNTAPAASLMRLPGVGPARAEAMIWLRESVVAVGGDLPFGSPQDLQRVKGFGPKTSERIGPALSFEGGGL